MSFSPRADRTLPQNLKGLAVETTTAYDTQSADRTAAQARAEGEAQLLRQLDDMLTEGGTVTSTRFFTAQQGDMLLVTLAAVFVLFKVLLQLAYVPSGSMETTIPTKCLLVGWRLPYVVSDPVPDRGDIVTFWDEELNKVLVKRVVGLPGETLSFKNGYTYVNGEKLDESYLPTQGITYPRHEGDTFTVPEGCIFFMGDNRGGSNDSRLLGEPYVPVSNIQGRMLVAISVGSDQSWQGVRWIG